MTAGTLARSLLANVALAGAALLSIGCNGEPVDSGFELLLGPSLSHTPAAESVPEGTDVEISVDATDEDGVGAVVLYFRAGGETYWDSAAMEPGEGDAWVATVPGEDVESPALEYYFKGADGRGLVGYLPEDYATAPFSVAVTEVGRALPFVETFDTTPDDDPIELAEGDDLYTLEWAVLVDGFAGYSWQLTTANAYSGDHAAYHPRGFDGVDTLDDWLITPALNLSGPDRIQVSWQEYGAAADGADHSLWISTGSRDPGAGDYEQLAVLAAATEGDWGRSAIVDLGDYAGTEKAWLAWRYVGSYADDWYVDDVVVREYTADLTAEISWDPDPVWPGETTTVTVTVTNAVDQGADDLSLSLSAIDGGGSFDPATVSLGAIDPNGTLQGEAEFSVDVDWPENSYLPVQIDISDALDTWSSAHDLIVGLPSTGLVDLEMSQAAFVEIWLGVGDPAAPEWEERVLNETLDEGANEIAVDLTDRYELLPPSVTQRWYARVESIADAAVTRFEIEYGGVTDASTDLPEVPASEPTTAYLPEPPRFEIVEIITTPETPAPGDDVTVELVLQNLGADTQGAVIATLESSDAHAILPDAEPTELSDDAWARDEELQTPPFSFSVDAAHTNDQDLALQLILEDELESWTLDLAVPVPWIVLRVVETEIDDEDSGDADGLLDPGESVELTIEIANTGSLDTDGLAELAISLDPSSVAGAALEVEPQTVGSLDPGDTEGVTFEIDVAPGAADGETLTLALALTDDRSTYTTTLDLELGAAAWQYLSATDDPVGDNNDYEFDFLNAQFRSDGQTIEFIFESATPFDPVTTFVELFAVNGGGGDYSFFRLVVQSQVAKLQGYDSGFSTIDTPTVEILDDYRMKVVADATVMDMTTGYLTVGLGSGWCSDATGEYCDHFPDDWGYYYTSYSSGDFFSLLW